ncbi:MAG: aminotransferase class V-fold PLP-dependent enzyme, partial [Bacteroidota bacterium]
MSSLHTQLDLQKIRADFPTLQQTVHGKPLVYLDNAATSQKPTVVLDRLEKYYREENSNVHRGVHYLSQHATDEYEGVREEVRALINAEHTHEIIYTSGTTSGINLVAQSFGQHFLKEGDEIIISHMEHHSNIVPWHFLRERHGAVLRWVGLTEDGALDMAELEAVIGPKTRLVALT